MLQILAWLAVLTAMLFALGEAIRPWRTRHWFKLVFLPGVLLSIGVQAVAARLCAEARFKASPLEEGEAAFFMQKRDLPPIAGAFFVLVSHALIFTCFFTLVSLFASVSALDPDAVRLPSLFPSHLSGESAPPSETGDLPVHQVSFGVRLVPYFLLLYVAVPVFANLRLRFSEHVAAGLLLVVLGLVHFSNFLGLGFPFVGRGWMARLLYFPPWWGPFSLYVMTAGIGLALAACGRLVARYVSSPEPRRRGATRVKLGQYDAEPEEQADEAGRVIYE